MINNINSFSLRVSKKHGFKSYAADKLENEFLVPGEIYILKRVNDYCFETFVVVLNDTNLLDIFGNIISINKTEQGISDCILLSVDLMRTNYWFCAILGKAFDTYIHFNIVKAQDMLRSLVAKSIKMRNIEKGDTTIYHNTLPLDVLVKTRIKSIFWHNAYLINNKGVGLKGLTIYCGEPVLYYEVNPLAQGTVLSDIYNTDFYSDDLKRKRESVDGAIKPFTAKYSPREFLDSIVEFKGSCEDVVTLPWNVSDWLGAMAKSQCSLSNIYTDLFSVKTRSDNAEYWYANNVRLAIDKLIRVICERRSCGFIVSQDAFVALDGFNCIEVDSPIAFHARYIGFSVYFETDEQRYNFVEMSKKVLGFDLTTIGKV